MQKLETIIYYTCIADKLLTQYFAILTMNSIINQLRFTMRYVNKYWRYGSVMCCCIVMLL